MASFSNRLQNTAQRLLSKYGQSIMFTRETEASYNTSTGEAITSGSTTYTGYGNPGEFTLLELQNSNILESDIKMYFYSTTAPKVGDSVSWNDVDYRIESIGIDSAQGNDCLYTLQLRLG